MARKKTATKRRRALFLDRLRKTGSVTEAWKVGELERRASWYELKERDAEFSEAWDTADREYMDGLESVSIKRAIVGEVENIPYTQLDGKGGKVTAFRAVTKKSDRLLELTLKSRHPLYKPSKAVEVTSPDGSMTPQANAVADFADFTDDELALYAELHRKAHANTAN